MQSLPSALLTLVCTTLLTLILTASASAQSVWELTPYRVRLLAAFAHSPDLTTQLQADLLAGLQQRIDVLVGAPWDFKAISAPPELRRAMISALQNVNLEALPKDSLQFDKVMLLLVAPEAGGHRVTVRELDVRTRLFSAPVSRPVRQLAKLRQTALHAIFDAFAPLAQVESVEQKRVVLRLKAAALPPRDEQLLRIAPGHVFRPVVRCNDREGNPRWIDPLRWTFLTVSRLAQQETGTPELLCRLHSGYRSPLSGRRRGRIEQLALAVVPPRNSSTLILRSRSEPKPPLAGYDVFAHPPDSKITVRLGRTDRRGRLTVPPGDSALRVLLVRNGTQPLARLPMVPGLEPELTAEIANDDERLEAEGFITGLQEQLVDLVTRREVLLARARARIEAGQFDEAEELIRKLRDLSLQTGPEFARTVAAHQRKIVSTDPAVQAKIDALFGDTKKLIDRHLNPQAIEQLRDDLRKAKAPSGS